MIQIKEYIRPKTLEEAEAALTGSRNAMIIGGGAYVRLGRKTISTAIDLSELSLNTIDDAGDRYAVGALVTFGSLERSPALDQSYHGLFRKALSDVVGVQFRNTVTVGGTVFSRFGFSDLIPPLLALDSEVFCSRNGNLKLEAFLKMRSVGKDILTHLEIPKSCTAASYQSVRLSTGDYAALNLVLTQMDGTWRIAVGARPGRACLANRTMELLNAKRWNDELMTEASACISQELVYGTNTRGSSGYRRQLAGALLRKAMTEVQHHAD